MAFFCASFTAIPTSLSLRLRSSSLNSVKVSRFRFSIASQKSLPLVLTSLTHETSVKSVSAKGGMENESEPWVERVHKSVEQITKSDCFEAEEFWMYDIRVSIAQESITVEDGDLIKVGLSKIKQMITSGEFVLRKDREDVHKIEAALIDMLGEPAKKLHIARSRDEHVVTVLRLFCRDAIDRVLNLFKKLQLEQDAKMLIDCKTSIDADSDRNFAFKLYDANIKTAETLYKIGQELAWGVNDPNKKHVIHKSTDQDLVLFTRFLVSYKGLLSADNPYLQEDKKPLSTALIR